MAIEAHKKKCSQIRVGKEQSQMISAYAESFRRTIKKTSRMNISTNLRIRRIHRSLIEPRALSTKTSWTSVSKCGSKTTSRGSQPNLRGMISYSGRDSGLCHRTNYSRLRWEGRVRLACPQCLKIAISLLKSSQKSSKIFSSVKPRNTWVLSLRKCKSLTALSGTKS